jgi:hypothetical protein
VTGREVPSECQFRRVTLKVGSGRHSLSATICGLTAVCVANLSETVQGLFLLRDNASFSFHLGIFIFTVLCIYN